MVRRPASVEESHASSGDESAAPAATPSVVTVEEVCDHWFQLFKGESGPLKPGAEDAHQMLCMSLMPDLAAEPSWTETSACFMAAGSQAVFNQCASEDLAPSPSPAPTAPPKPDEPAQISFFDLFLAANDVPQGMMQMQKPTPQHNDDGSVFGFSMWMNGSNTATMQSFFDLRWVFNSPEEATRFIEESADKSLSEGYPKMPNAQKIGQDCRVYGGEGKAGITAIVYVYRVGPVVVKNFSGQGKQATSPLKAVMMVPYVQKAHDKLAEVFQ